MTRSDEMMLSAIRLRVAMQMNGRDVSVEGDRVKVALHGVPAMVVRFDSGDVRVNGMLKVSRKSAKVLNAVLRTYKDCTVASVEDLIKAKFPSIDIAFRCEEPGMAIYEKNNNVFFPEDYIVDIEDDNTYYLMESEALQTLSDFFGIDFKDMDEAMILVRENNDKDDGRIWVNKYEFVE